jgi:hypothetical protein
MYIALESAILISVCGAGDNLTGCPFKPFAAQAESIVDSNRRGKIFLFIKGYLARKQVQWTVEQRTADRCTLDAVRWTLKRCKLLRKLT